MIQSEDESTCVMYTPLALHITDEYFINNSSRSAGKGVSFSNNKVFCYCISLSCCFFMSGFFLVISDSVFKICIIQNLSRLLLILLGPARNE